MPQSPNGVKNVLVDSLTERQREEMEQARREWARRMDSFRQQKKPKRAFN